MNPEASFHSNHGFLKNEQNHGVSIIQKRELQRERSQIDQRKSQSRTKSRCQHAKWLLETVFHLAFLIILELRYRFAVQLTVLSQRMQVLFYLLLVSLILRFLFYRVIKKDFNSMHGFLLTFSRFFLVFLTYTVTAKLDKDVALSDT